MANAETVVVTTVATNASKVATVATPANAQAMTVVPKGAIAKKVFITDTATVAEKVWFDGALGLLNGESQGLGILGTSSNVQLAIKDTGTPANSRSNIDINDATSPVVDATTSPKLVLQSNGQYAWAAHNLFLNSGSPATQNVTLISGLTYTMSVTGSGSLAGSSGASGTATAGTPATFTATGATGTFTVTGTLATIQLNRGTVPTAYRATTSAASFATAEQWDPTLGKYAVLSEPQAANLLVYGSTFSNGNWTGGGYSVAENATAAPDGTQTAEVITATTGAGLYIFQWINVTATSYTGSLFVKGIGTTIGKTLRFWWWIAGTATGPGGLVSVVLTADWQRISIPTTFTGGGITYIRFDFNNLEAAGDQFSAYWGQAEAGTVATSPIPTAAATVTRAADAISVATSKFPWTASAFALVQRFKPSVSNAMLVQIDNGSGANRYFMYHQTTVVDSEIFVSSTREDQRTATDNGNGAWSISAYTAQLNDSALSVNAGVISTGTPPALPTGLTTLAIGDASYGGYATALMTNKLIYLPRRVSNVQLQQMTAN